MVTQRCILFSSQITPKNISTIGTCEDDAKIQITLIGDALSAAGHVQGIYVKFATSNRKPAWNHASHNYSIWWGSNGFWMIGPKAEIGSSTGWLYNPKSRQPYGNGNDWLYHNGTAWVNPIGEIKVKCNQSTLLVLIDFCPAYCEFLTLRVFFAKTFDILQEIIME